MLFQQSKSKDLDRYPTTLEELKFVLKTISDIKLVSLDIETRIRDMQERFRTLCMYDLPVSILFIYLIGVFAVLKNNSLVQLQPVL